MFDIFDGADPAMSCPERDVTTVAPQALWLLNNGISFQQARRLAERVAKEAAADAAARVERAWELALQRSPSPQERQQALELMDALRAGEKASQPDLAPLEKLCLAILNLSEFIFID
jgi:hypothetical protein